jgi:hypothetical protein
MSRPIETSSQSNPTMNSDEESELIPTYRRELVSASLDYQPQDSILSCHDSPDELDEYWSQAIGGTSTIFTSFVDSAPKSDLILPRKPAPAVVINFMAASPSILEEIIGQVSSDEILLAASIFDYYKGQGSFDLMAKSEELDGGFHETGSSENFEKSQIQELTKEIQETNDVIQGMLQIFITERILRPENITSIDLGKFSNDTPSGEPKPHHSLRRLMHYKKENYQFPASSPSDGIYSSTFLKEKKINGNAEPMAWTYNEESSLVPESNFMEKSSEVYSQKFGSDSTHKNAIKHYDSKCTQKYGNANPKPNPSSEKLTITVEVEQVHYKFKP